MRMIFVWMTILAALLPMSLRAEEGEHTLKCACMKADEVKKAEGPAGEMKCCCKKEAEAKKAEQNNLKEMQQKMEAKMKAEAAEFDKLVDEMNASTGDKKIEAMAAIINKMAQKHKEMHAKMSGTTKSDAKPAAEVDYYTCKMHPAVHWPAPGKCPTCSMDLVPVFKKASGAKPEEKSGAKKAKPGEEIKNTDELHAEHKH